MMTTKDKETYGKVANIKDSKVNGASMLPSKIELKKHKHGTINQLN